MSNSITPISPAVLPQSLPEIASADKSGSFGSILESVIDNTEKSRRVADQAVTKFLSGENEDLHSVALATQRADLEFSMFLQVRNKVVSAYQEIMKLQV